MTEHFDLVLACPTYKVQREEICLGVSRNCRGNISSANEILPRVFKSEKRLLIEMDKTHRFIKRMLSGQNI